MTRAEALVAAAFRGFGEALLAADGGGKKEREPKTHVIPVDAVKAAVQEALPGILQAMADEAPPTAEELDRPFGLGDVERQTFDPNMPGTGGWGTAPE